MKGLLHIVGITNISRLTQGTHSGVLRMLQRGLCGLQRGLLPLQRGIDLRQPEDVTRPQGQR